MTDAIARAVAASATVGAVVIGPGVLDRAPALLRAHLPGHAVCVIADENTWAAAGQRVAASVAAAGMAVRHHILPATPRPKPTVELATTLAGVLSQDDAIPVAVGSGVINDVVKHAAFALGRPYLCVATAASMDGYTSAGAPLSERGFKKTIACRPARVILADLDVIARAPAEMNAWGYGDTAGKVPAGADWIIADALGIEPIDPQSWDMVQSPLRGWLSSPERIAAADPAAIADLFTGLTMVGLAMERHGSSRPASGAEHQIAHLWEMEDLHHGGQRVSHGACVAVGCITTLRLYAWLLAQDRLVPRAAASLPAKATAIRAAFGPGDIADRALAETAAKHPDAGVLALRLSRLQDQWPSLRARLAQQIIAPPDMVDHLNRAGCPAEAADIGISADHLRRSIFAARFLRSRYTVLDLLDDTGLLAAAVDAILPAAPLWNHA
jgi:glycerol-1-phosphate dehydrogenase [NAD(P)+]